MLEGISHYNLRDFCCLWCEEWGVEPNRDEYAWVKVAEGATTFIKTSWGGGKNPSPFKRAAASAMSIVTLAPVGEHIPDNIVVKYELDGQMAKHPKILKAIIAHAFAGWVLQNSKIGDCSPDKQISNPIKISPHFLRDLLSLLASSSFQNGHLFSPLSLIYEACVYQTNPKAQDV